MTTRPMISDRPGHGAEVVDEVNGTFRVTFKPVTGAFTSKYFDTMRVSIERLATRKNVGTWTLQRARLVNGRPEANKE